MPRAHKNKSSCQSTVSLPFPSPTYYEGEAVRAARIAANGHIINTNWPTASLLKHRMIHLGLIPRKMDYDSELNVMPDYLASNRCVIDDRATLYPCEQSLLDHIEIEERQLLRREQLISEQKKDPGRPTYEESYGALPKLSVFNLWAVGHNPRGVPSFLPLSVNLVVRMKTTVFAKILARYGEMVPLYMRTHELGRYLMQLWEAKPRNFRSLERPLHLHSLPKPSSPIVTIETPQEPEEQLFVDKVDLRTPLADSDSEMSSTMAPLTANTSVMQVEAELSIDKEEELSDEPLVPYHQISKIGTNGRFTSNEWALACYGVDLGGPVWDFDSMYTEEKPEPELEPLDDVPGSESEEASGWGCTIC